LDVEVRKEVVNRLSKDSGPVDGVYCSQAVFLVEFPISEESFDNVLYLGSVRHWKSVSTLTHLAVVERSFDRYIVDVFIGDRSHLGLLNGRDTALGMEDEN
jgi:hypothetical protein